MTQLDCRRPAIFLAICLWLPTRPAVVRADGAEAAAASAQALFSGTGDQARRMLSDATPQEDGLSFAADENPVMHRYLAPAAPNGRVDLSRIDPSDTGMFGDDEKKALKKFGDDEKKLDGLQQRLYAEGKRRVLIIFQAMDTGGKDGVIKDVVRLNPQGVVVTSFKQPTEVEAAHDFLWRIKNQLPARGMIRIFNRSQYEDILVPTVYGTLPREQVEARYDAVNDFERALAKDGTIIVKFFLYISKEEQKRRLQDRLDQPDKNWKFSASDLKTRERWPEFMDTYARILARTNTPWAPWYVIPADNKWYRNYLVARILRKTLEQLDMRYPDPPPGLDKIVIPD